jgi:hypothetical protein
MNLEKVTDFDATGGGQQGIVKSLEEFITDYGTLPKPYYALPIALWTLGTYCYRKFDAFGYLCFTAAANGAGKSRMLEILECICCRAKYKTKITLPGMCSLIEKNNPTLLLDQAEGLARDEHNDLMVCILNGYRARSTVTVQYNREPVDRPIYCPKAFALLGTMMPAARDRAIVIEMRQARSRKRWYWPEASQRGGAIQKRCAALTLERADDIEDSLANFVGLPFLQEREEEIWTVPFVMCETFCADRRAELEGAAADICAAKRATPAKVNATQANQQAHALRDGETLLRDMLAVCGPVAIRTIDAKKALMGMHDAPWHNYAGEGLDDQKIAELLRPYGVAPRQIKIDGRNLRGYLRADLIDALEAVGHQDPATPLPSS